MRIGIDARFLNESGVGRYLKNLLKGLKELDKKNEYSILLLKKDCDNFIETKNFKKILADFAWYGFAEQFNLPKILNKYQFDLVHFPHFNVPIFYSGKFVVTIHDLIHQHHSMNRSTTLNPVTFKIKQFGYGKVFRNAVSKSQKIIVPSNCVKELLIGEWKVNSEKIVVTPEAVDERIISLNSKMSKHHSEDITKKLGVKAPFIFYVGNAHPHKNVEGLIKAFLILRKKYHYLSLVLAGHDHYFWERIKAENVYKDIKYLGQISDEQMVALLKMAEAFVLPSFEEGFGLSLLESMVCRCPVVSSNRASLPEVGGDAAIYFDPDNVSDMVEKISKILKDRKFAKDLIAKGKQRIKLFSWDRLSRQTLEVYGKFVKSK